MANPQKEDGYTAIANEIMEALCRSSPGGSEGQVLWAIIRKTYGWHKKADRISISQLSEMTGVSRRMVIYAIKNLEAKNMITVNRSNEHGVCGTNSIAIQKNHEEWVVQETDGSARKSASYKATIEKQKQRYRVVQETKGSARNGGVVQDPVNDVPFLAPTKETNTKEKDSPPKNQPPKAKPSVTLAGEQAVKFSQFYAAYPKKRAKQDAIKAWKKVAPENGLFETIMRAIGKQRRSDDWTRDNGRYIPNPASWLNGRRWEDEIEAPGPAKRTGSW